MFDWLPGIVGEDAAPIAAYVLIFVLLLIGFFIVRSVLRRMGGGTFVHGGRGRKQRLAIIDATPVDNRRRLVLLRRDNVEHLVLIGGMNDLVVERDIEAQPTPKVELPDSAPSTKQQQNKAPLPSKPAKARVTPDPKPRKIIAEPKPDASHAEKAPDVEQSAPTKSPEVKAAPMPMTKKIEPAVIPSAAAAVTGLAEPQPSPPVAQESVKLDEPARVEPATNTEPVVGRFSAYAENDSATAPEVAIEKPEPSATVDEKPEVTFDEFMPIDAPSPSVSTPVAPSPKVEAEVEPADADLEDEMEELLNKLTKPSQF